MIERAPCCCYAWAMADDPKPEPIKFPVTVEVNGVKVEIVLLLRPATAVTIEKEPDNQPDSFNSGPARS